MISPGAMAFVVDRLAAGAFPEAIPLLDRVFATDRPHGFAGMLPFRYQPTLEHMRRQLAVREDGRIVATLELSPRRWHLCPRTLSIAGIGGVCVAPTTASET
ncbi:MAG: GNAT family N-acetyltransferase [Polyangiaceae bacterium]|nr:GNAT family N-acetyltransferase [Polyangiaceae bacterium]